MNQITLIGEKAVKGNINPQVQFPEPQPFSQYKNKTQFGNPNIKSTKTNKPNISALKKEFDPFFDKHVKKLVIDDVDQDTELDPVIRNIIRKFLEKMLDFKYKNLKMEDILVEGEIIDMIDEIGQVINEMYGIAEITLELANK